MTKSLREYVNDVMNDNRIFSYEDVLAMDNEEGKYYQKALDYQYGKIGFPNNAELANSSDVVYVHEYTRQDGTVVRAHYRSKAGHGNPDKPVMQTPNEYKTTLEKEINDYMDRDVENRYGVPTGFAANEVNNLIPNNEIQEQEGALADSDEDYYNWLLDYVANINENNTYYAEGQQNSINNDMKAKQYEYYDKIITKLHDETERELSEIERMDKETEELLKKFDDYSLDKLGYGYPVIDTENPVTLSTNSEEDPLNVGFLIPAMEPLTAKPKIPDTRVMIENRPPKRKWGWWEKTIYDVGTSDLIYNEQAKAIKNPNSLKSFGAKILFPNATKYYRIASTHGHSVLKGIDTDNTLCTVNQITDAKVKEHVLETMKANNVGTHTLVVLPKSDSKLVQDTKNSKVVKNALKNSNWKLVIPINFRDENRDLHKTFGHAHLYNPHKDKDGNVLVTLIDYYDFDKANAGSSAGALNDNAYRQQQEGGMTNYVLLVELKYTPEEWVSIVNN